jgi:hypothetical protein
MDPKAPKLKRKHAESAQNRRVLALQHSGITTGSMQQQNITVVPDSGSGQLGGLAGKLTVKIVDGRHSYDFDYTLP